VVTTRSRCTIPRTVRPLARVRPRGERRQEGILATWWCSEKTAGKSFFVARSPVAPNTTNASDSLLTRCSTGRGIMHATSNFVDAPPQWAVTEDKPGASGKHDLSEGKHTSAHHRIGYRNTPTSLGVQLPLCLTG
jgi:hypothetical protein